jgi:transcriptional antiterminator RfaH
MDVMMNWYVVNTKTHQEKTALANLQKAGVETFCPLLKKGESRVPLFPGYLFARFNFGSHYRLVNFAHGVRRLVVFGSEAAIVDHQVIESIRCRLENNFLTEEVPSFVFGQPVRIMDGPFQGLEAVFERTMSDQQRVMVLLQALSFQAHVVVNLGAVVNP